MRMRAAGTSPWEGRVKRRNDGTMERWAGRRGRWMMAVFLSIIPTVQLSAQTFEERLLAVPDTASVRAMSRALSAVPHMAGTPAQETTRDYALERSEEHTSELQSHHDLVCRLLLE